MSTESPDRLTAPQVAELIGHVSERWVLRQYHAGRLKGLRLSPRKTLFERAEVEAFLKRVRHESSAAVGS